MYLAAPTECFASCGWQGGSLGQKGASCRFKQEKRTFQRQAVCRSHSRTAGDLRAHLLGGHDAGREDMVWCLTVKVTRRGESTFTCLACVKLERGVSDPCFVHPRHAMPKKKIHKDRQRHTVQRPTTHTNRPLSIRFDLGETQREGEPKGGRNQKRRGEPRGRGRKDTKKGGGGRGHQKGGGGGRGEGNKREGGNKKGGGGKNKNG